MSDVSPSHHFDFEETTQNAPRNEEVPPQNSPRATPPQDSSRENPPPSLDLESMSDDDEDLGYVDIDDFVQLQNCFDNLSKSHDTLNQNVTMLTELTTNFIKMNPPQDAGHAHMHAHAGTSLAVPPPHASPTITVPSPHVPTTHVTTMQDTHMVFVEDPTKLTTAKVLKNLKPPGFKGEDKEQNKDTVDTFLSKWGEIHKMRGTMEHNKPLHTCLSLEGKA